MPSVTSHCATSCRLVRRQVHVAAAEQPAHAAPVACPGAGSKGVTATAWLCRPVGRVVGDAVQPANGISTELEVIGTLTGVSNALAHMIS